MNTMKRSQWEAMDLARKATAETGLEHGYCDDCHEIRQYKDLVSFGDEHNTYLVLGTCCTDQYTECNSCGQAVTATIEIADDFGICKQCNFNLETKEEEEEEDALEKAMMDTITVAWDNESITSERVRRRLQLGIDNQLPF